MTGLEWAAWYYAQPVARCPSCGFMREADGPRMQAHARRVVDGLRTVEAGPCPGGLAVGAMTRRERIRRRRYYD